MCGSTLPAAARGQRADVVTSLPGRGQRPPAKSGVQVLSGKRGMFTVLRKEWDNMGFRVLRKGPSAPPRARSRARLEPLESRVLLSTVPGAPDTTWGDGGSGLVLTDFGVAPSVTTDVARGMVVQADGKIVTAGFA